MPDRVEENVDTAVAPPLVGREDRLDRVPHAGPVEAQPLDDRGRDVDLGVRDPLPPEAGGQVAREEGEVGRSAEEPADVAVEREEPRQALEPAPGSDSGEVREEGRAGTARQGDEARRPDGPLEVEVELGLRPEAEGAEELGVDHAGPSYGTARPGAPPRVPPERRWLRAAAFGLDLICLAGGPLLLATVVVLLVVLFASVPPAGLPWVFRAAQLLFVVLFLLRDVLGTSPGKVLLGLSVVRIDSSPVRPFDSVLRNLPLLLPGLNLVEAVEVVRRSDARRLGDRLAGTTVRES
jgi:uncharacterized RDD family membrane protein YckC